MMDIEKLIHKSTRLYVSKHYISNGHWLCPRKMFSKDEIAAMIDDASLYEGILKRTDAQMLAFVATKKPVCTLKRTVHTIAEYTIFRKGQYWEALNTNYIDALMLDCVWYYGDYEKNRIPLYINEILIVPAIKKALAIEYPSEYNRIAGMMK